jgi:hypothetical protein
VKVGDVLARYKPAERQVRILLDGALQAEIDELRQRIKQVQREEAGTQPGLRSRVPALREEMDKLEARAEEAAVLFKLTAIPGKTFDRLRYENPPTEEDWQRYRQTQDANTSLAVLGRIGAPEFHFDGFMAKLIGLSMAEVDGETAEWSEADGVELWGTLHDGARAALADAAWEVNGQRSSRPLSENATGTTSNSDSESTTAASGESPTPSSSDEPT